MKNKITFFAACALVFAVLVAPASHVRGDTNSAAVYLAGKDSNPWAIMALAANGGSPDVDHLKNVSGSEAIDFEAPILALVAAGKDPRIFPDTDLVAALQGRLSNGQIGDPNILNDDIFGILALSASGVSSGDPSISAPRQFLLDNQNADGGWAFALGATSDTNTTAAAIMALLDSGSSPGDAAIVGALAYLRSSQNADGGLPYDPHSAWGTDSDASSDAWAIMALNKAGIDPGSWDMPGGDPVSNLLSMQAGPGYFQFQPGSGEDAFSPVTTSYGLIALLGRSFPVGRVSGSDPDPVPATGASFRIEGKNGLVCAGSNDAADALDIIRLAADACGFTYDIQETAYGPYLKRIAADSAEGANGWMYAVNGVLPSIGAADYELEEGDKVVWHYGDPSWEPGSGPSLQNSLGLAVNIVTSTIPVETSISFSVDADGAGMLDFGSVTVGATAKKTVTIRNQGQTGIAVSADVSGDAVFQNYLSIDGGMWSSYAANLAAGAAKNSEVKISLPTTLQSRGMRNGSLIFWATEE